VLDTWYTSTSFCLVRDPTVTFDRLLIDECCPVFYKPYESQGQAWPITFVRLIWGVVIFLLFMIGIFTLRKSYILSSLLVPLLACTIAWSWYIHHSLQSLSKFVSLSSVYEVQRGEETAEVLRLKAGHPVSWSQSHLNRRRYAQNDDTLYVAPEDERTDYVRSVLFLNQLESY
jgi:hypothetical protein